VFLQCCIKTAIREISSRPEAYSDSIARRLQGGKGVDGKVREKWLLRPSLNPRSATGWEFL